LNPNLFRDSVYTRFTLDNFGTESWASGVSAFAKGDVVTVGCDVHVFVFGEWTVPNEDDINWDDYGRLPQIVEYLDPLLSVFWWMSDWLSNPLNALTATIMIILVIALILFFAFPTSSLALLALFRSGNKRRRRR
jgi:hypothetical protein